MRLHRFYIEEKIDERGEITLTDPELIHQMVNVFRFNTGDKVILFDGFGAEYICEIINLNKKPARPSGVGGEVVFKILEKSSLVKTQDEKVSVSLYLSLIKKGNFELAAEKCTEIGVTEIHPIISERSEKKDLNLDRLNKIVKEASEQSGRVTLPKVYEIKSLEQAVSQVVKEGKVGVVFHTEVSAEHNRSFNRPEHNRPGHQNDHPALVKAGIGGGYKIATFIGPEGGWGEKEIELFKQNNFIFESLGSNILRAETAVIVAVWKFLNS